MLFNSEFESFDPVSGYVPDYPCKSFSVIATRARSILAGWSKDQIGEAANRVISEVNVYFGDLKSEAVDELRWRLQDDPAEFVRFFEWDDGTNANGQWLFREEMEDELDIPTQWNCSEVDALKTIIDDRDSCLHLSQAAPLPEIAHWPEGSTEKLFAALALWLLACAIRASENLDRYSLANAGNIAAEAMDAVCYAEQLHEVDWLERYHEKKLVEVTRNEDTRRAELVEIARRKFAEEQAEHERVKRSARSAQMNASRHANRHRAKDLACVEWAKTRFKYSSFEKAGDDFADWVVDKQLLEKVEPRTVAGWLRDYGREIGFRYK
jgi:hypothetical protein